MKISNGFVGCFSGFKGTAAANIAPNAVIIAGKFVGVTHQAFAAGDTYLAFLGHPVNVYNFTLAETASEAIAVGTTMYMDSNGKVTTTAASNTLIGYVWNGAGVGDTDVDVALATACDVQSTALELLPAIAGNAGKVLAVNAEADGLEWKADATA